MVSGAALRAPVHDHEGRTGAARQPGSAPPDEQVRRGPGLLGACPAGADPGRTLAPDDETAVEGRQDLPRRGRHDDRPAHRSLERGPIRHGDHASAFSRHTGNFTLRTVRITFRSHYEDVSQTLRILFDYAHVMSIACSLLHTMLGGARGVIEQ
jgi:hypothetical protein